LDGNHYGCEGPLPRTDQSALAEGLKVTSGRVFRPDAGGVVPRPPLIERLGAAARMTVVSGPPGSGKTVLLRSWVAEAGLAERVAWVPAGRDERDPQRFWLSVLGALRETIPGSALVQPLTAAPDLDGWAIVERLLADLAPLTDRIWLAELKRRSRHDRVNCGVGGSASAGYQAARWA
jgi:ATP/maltotriose-dependent transcriptional regulator MalT